MKKFVEITVQFKFVWALLFTASLLLYSTISMLLGKSSVDFIVIWGIVAMTIVLTFIHYLIFGEFILNSLSTTYKILIHFVLCYITIFISSLLLDWISILSLSSIGLFTGSYMLLYLSCAFSFYAYYKATGEELNNRLTAYKEKKNIS
jgi:hypothetical protein